MDVRSPIVLAAGPATANVRRNLAYGPEPHQRLDVYRPSDVAADERRPGVVFVHGDGDPEALRAAKDWGQYQSWAELIASTGLVGLTFDHRSSQDGRAFDEAAGDVGAALEFVLGRGRSLGVDTTRLAVWTCSAGPPLVLPRLLARPAPWLRCIVVYYGVMDLAPLVAAAGARDVPSALLDRASALRSLGAGRVALPPMLIARAGRDSPALNETIDAFVAAACTQGVTLDLLTHPEGGHGFDVTSDTPRSRAIIRDTVRFLRENLLPSGD